MTGVKCPKCGQMVSNIDPDEEYFCWRCGAKFTPGVEGYRVVYDERKKLEERKQRMEEERRKKA